MENDKIVNFKRFSSNSILCTNLVQQRVLWGREVLCRETELLNLCRVRSNWGWEDGNYRSEKGNKDTGANRNWLIKTQTAVCCSRGRLSN